MGGSMGTKETAGGKDNVRRSSEQCTELPKRMFSHRSLRRPLQHRFSRLCSLHLIPWLISLIISVPTYHYRIYLVYKLYAAYYLLSSLEICVILQTSCHIQPPNPGSTVATQSLDFQTDM